MNRRMLLSGIVSLFVIATAPAQLSATELAEGTQTFVPAKYTKQNKRNIASAIEQTVESVNFMLRGFARDKLTEGLTLRPKVVIDRSGDDVTVTYGHETYTTPASGKSVSRINPKGDRVKVSQKVVGAKVIQTVKSADGARYITFALVDESTLALKVKITTPRLDDPIKYKLKYAAR